MSTGTSNGCGPHRRRMVRVNMRSVCCCFWYTMTAPAGHRRPSMAQIFSTRIERKKSTHTHTPHHTKGVYPEFLRSFRSASATYSAVLCAKEMPCGKCMHSPHWLPCYVLCQFVFTVQQSHCNHPCPRKHFCCPHTVTVRHSRRLHIMPLNSISNVYGEQLFCDPF